ncbi:ribose-phosphate pyrophosphokinase [Ethanoligenens harbinense]|uniref:ribose-phosphate diphosphokinase n=1 Tax=Ethanoligenens harbinense (strain DSM 18485 / JCM 12961 / CGMCC 1.5033 / YUAN-3) TaxID=663278 RepID=E6U6P7_ETHHY|nr:ribose-phosphate pyrophosphokinase [Ethanoligenens harbinense]ADU25780.1 ribose-phosphate pyrophosphokinase [Ethanoligenens harbinense YUAN-3]AVQ94949.1 phosphoribosylpyrophosphate synthetase [Ethanoligenens harbinense YUAN-3]AYF37641.1 phosphoribosylpyrophosphate synthetase [Ethanoligenens harbinense]AYF40361.1 phosphoribosylpyrophosphate synthetase [Ethanoligenens harbinense]QCN91197.1 ribose-phosphate pyrophosphokinase [Ethanoligenens harbinense]
MSGEELKMPMPVGELGIVGMNGCEDTAMAVNDWLTHWRGSRNEHGFKIEVECPRFGTGEGKSIIRQSVRGHDLFIITDMFNYGITYDMYGMQVPMSPDDHFQDLTRIIAAAGGKARRINVIMPMLYEGRQHRRTSRESLDCAVMLQQLQRLGVENIITFDAHDPRVQNAIPLIGFENIHPTYQMLKALVREEPDIRIDRSHVAVISPDEGGLNRCIYYSSVLELELGMFYKRRDYTRIVGGRNPIISHEYLGGNLEGKDVIIVDDIISSGDSMLDIAEQLRAKKVGRIFMFASFGLFCNGLKKFDEAYAAGLFDRVFTTNLVYRTEALKARPWYAEVDMSKYIALVIDTLNFDRSMSELLNPVGRIHRLMARLEQSHQAADKKAAKSLA